MNPKTVRKCGETLVSPHMHRRPGLLPSLIAGLIMIAALTACGRGDRNTAEGFAEFNKELNDSLSKGNTDFVRSRIAEAKLKGVAEGDSDLWANALVQQSIAAYYASDPATLISSCDSALAYLTRRPSSPVRDAILEKGYMTKGAYYSQYAFMPDSAIKYHRLGVELAPRAFEKNEYAIALGNMADTYKLTGHLPEAAEYYHRAIHVADSLGLGLTDYIPLYGGLAATYTALRDFRQSRVWWDRTMTLYPLMIPYERFNNLNNLGNDCYYRKDYPEALATFKRLSAYLDSLPDADWERNFANVNLADSYLRLEHPDSASPLIDSSMEFFTTTQPNPVVESYLHTLLMRKYALKGNYAAVEDLIDHHLFSDTLRAEQQTGRLEVMADYYEYTGQYRMALDTYRRLQAMEDTLRSERVDQLVASWRIKYENDTELLRLRADKSDGEAHILMLSLVIFVGAVVIAVLAVVTVVLRVRSRRNEERMHAGMIALRMQSIRTRITPHFIYNALNHEILARQGDKPSRLGSIVSLLRHQQYVAEETVITLAKELDFVSDYVAVERDAFEGDVEYTVNVGPDIDSDKLLIPSMSLQILAENSFKHSFRHLKAGETGHLVIDVRRDDNLGATVITVFNTMCGETPSQPGSPQGTGTRIIMQTLSFINSKVRGDLRFNMQTGRSPHWGQDTWACITIPYGTDLSIFNTETE